MYQPTACAMPSLLSERFKSPGIQTVRGKQSRTRGKGNMYLVYYVGIISAHMCRVRCFVFPAIVLSFSLSLSSKMIRRRLANYIIITTFRGYHQCRRRVCARKTTISSLNYYIIFNRKICDV